VVTALETPTDGGSVRGVSGNASHAETDRVAERRRAVALARHYREFEGLTIQQIADLLGRAPATVKRTSTIRERRPTTVRGDAPPGASPRRQSALGCETPLGP
jgi:hypothetical protein